MAKGDYKSRVLFGCPARLLCLTDAVHGSAADRTHTFGGWLPVLERYLLRVLYLPLRPALEAVSLHLPSFGVFVLAYTIRKLEVKPFSRRVKEGTYKCIIKIEG